MSANHNMQDSCLIFLEAKCSLAFYAFLAYNSTGCSIRARGPTSNVFCAFWKQSSTLSHRSGGRGVGFVFFSLAKDLMESSRNPSADLPGFPFLGKHILLASAVRASRIHEGQNVWDFKYCPGRHHLQPLRHKAAHCEFPQGCNSICHRCWLC